MHKARFMAAAVAVAVSLAVAGAGPATAKPGAPSDFTLYSGDRDTLRVIFYQHANRGGAQLIYYGGSRCTATLDDFEYSQRVMPPNWNDEISWWQDFNSCDVKLYPDGPFQGTPSPWMDGGSGNGRYVGDNFNDKTSSFRVS